MDGYNPMEMESNRDRRPIPTVADVHNGWKIQLCRPWEAVSGAEDSFRSSFNMIMERALEVIGIVLMATGVCGLMLVISTPFNAMGAFVYLFAGIFIAFIHSETLRFYILQCLSKKVYEVLYEKSILEIMMEPSPFMKLVVLVCLSGALDSPDLNELVNSLPPSCDVLKKRGIVNVLPRMVGVQICLHIYMYMCMEYVYFVENLISHTLCPHFSCEL